MTTHATPRGRRSGVGRARAAFLPSLAALLLTTACSGSDGDGGDDPSAVLAEAKSQLDETPGLSLSLTTDELPDGVDGVLSATGVGSNAPAFDGDIKLVVNNITVDVPVVAVDGKVFATLPFTKRFVEIDPGDYGAPDPADLLSPDGGVSSWLTEATDVTEGDEVRDGDRVLTSYRGSLPGEAVDAVIPTADESADFEVTFQLDEDNKLAAADLMGPFYGSDGQVAYGLALSDYGTEQDITAP
jgi:lipoprotein LprG